MRTPVFTGSCPALVTPFDQNNIINYDAFGRLIDAQIEAGVDAVCVCGTTGESATMSIREHIAAVEFCVKRVNHRVKVIAGAGSNDTSAAVYLSQHAQDSGADALLHVTPFDQNNIINYDAFGRLIDAQIEAGVDAVCVCGTTGESATMSIREHIAAVEFCVKRVNHRVKVIAGAGSNDTSAAVYLSQHAQDSGADALLHVTPYYNKASQAGLIKHYEYIADRVELPIILYNVPGRTGVSFTAETYKVLSENPKINGVKEASGNFSLLAHTRFLCGDDFFIWSGNDDQVVPMMALGAKGVISVASNIVPKVMVKMSHLCLDNDFAAASRLQIQYMDLIDALFTEVNPIPIKAAMNLLGMEAGPLRLPLCDISEKNLEVLHRAMGRADLLREPALQI